MRRATILAVLGCLALDASGPRVGREGAAGASDPPADADTPRNVRREAPFIEFVEARPRGAVARVGDRFPARSDVPVEWSAHHRARRSHRLLSGGTTLDYVEEETLVWSLDDRPRAPVPGQPTRRTSPVDRFGPPIRVDADGRRHRLDVRIGNDADRASVVTDALPVVLFVEAATAKEGDRRFGSFPRRVRASLDAWNDLAAAAVHPAAPNGLLDRFRLDGVVVYARADGLPAAFRAHPEAALALAFDEGGPGVEGYDPATASILVTGKGRPRGLWSAGGERFLWAQLLRSRGIAAEAYAGIPVGALPGREAGPLPPPAPVRDDLLATPAGTKISAWSAVVANANRGVAWTGDPDDPANVKCGPTWSWVAPRLDVFVTQGAAPVVGATVRWFRPRRAAGAASPRVASDAPADGSAATDATGRASLERIDLGRSLRPEERTRWLLVEVEAPSGRARRVVTAAELHVLYATGGKFFSTLSVPLAP